MNSTTTSLDTNVLVYLMNQDSSLNHRALAAIEKASAKGPLVVSGPV